MERKQQGQKKDMDKTWRENSKERLSEYFKEYAGKNKERKKAYNQQKYYCECGAVLCLSSKSHHKNSKGDQDWLNRQKDE